MTGELTEQGLIDFRSPTLRAIPTVTFSFPGSNTRRYAIRGAPVQSSLGIFRDRLTDIGDMDYRLSDPRGGLQSVSTFFQVDDIDGDIRSIVQRYGPAAMRGCAVVCDYATGSPIGDWPRLFTGILDSVDPAPGLQWRFSARVDDRPLTDGTFRVHRLSSIDFEGILAPDLERIMPVALGQFDSRDGTVAGSTGSVELIRLAEVHAAGFPYGYFLAAPYMSSVMRVANNGSVVSSSTWVRTYTIRNGIATTEVWFASDPGSSAKMTAEIMGVGEDVAGAPAYIGQNGTGSPVVNIVRQIRWLLRNYVWSSYRSGAFATDPSAIGTSTWDAAEAWAEQRRFRGSVLIKDSTQKPGDVFNAFCQWAWIRAGWSRTGKLNLYPFTDEDAPYFSDTRWIRYALKGSEDAFLPTYPRDRAANALRSASWIVPAAGAGRSMISVRDSRVTGNVVVEINHNLGVARQEFQDGYPGPANLRLALNGSRPGYQGNAVYLANASALARWRDVNWSPAGPSYDFPNSYRSENTMVSSGGTEPKWFAGAVNGHGLVRFDGSNDFMDSSHSAASYPEWCVWIVFRLLSASLNNANAYDNHGIACDGNAVWTVSARTSGGIYYLQADNMNSGGVHAQVEAAIPLNTWIVARARRFGSKLSLSVDNFTEVSVASGSSWATPSIIRLGANSNKTAYATVDIAALYVWDNGDMSKQGASSGDATPGLGSNFDVWQAMKARYRV